MKKLVIAAPKSGSGKTILTCGLLELLKRRQIPTASFKCGPDYIDPLFHKRILGVESRNLDSFFETPEGLREVFIRGCLGKETGLALIEGVMGYFDGLGGILPKASTYEVAKTLEAPVILTVDARGSSLSLAALIKGFLDYAPFDIQDEKEKKSRIKGVVLNQVSPMIYPGLKKVIEEELGITVAGYIPRMDFLHIESRHLGLVLPDEIADLKEQMGKLADILETSLDVSALLEIAEGERKPEQEMPETGQKMPASKEQMTFHLAVAKDEAFCFYYHENLKAMEEQGAILTYFSPLHDERIPEDADGLLIGGGYPELYAERLAKNETMRTSIYQAAASGMPIHGECGGYLYLLETLEGADGKNYPMCGVFSGIGKRGERLGNFGYITLRVRRDSAFLKENAGIRAHEFHYWQVEKTEAEQENALMDANKPAGIREWKAMEEKWYTLAGFPHFYYRSCPEFGTGFAAACRQYRQTVYKRSPVYLRLEDGLKQVRGLDMQSVKQAKKRWDSVAKPLNSLGLLEEAIIKIAGIQESAQVNIEKKAIVICCSDNGIVKEGVTQTGQEVTGIVTKNFARGESCVCLMAKQAGARVIPIDLGVASLIPGAGKEFPDDESRIQIWDRKISWGTNSFLHGPAMEREQAVLAVETGILAAAHLKKQGYSILATGEMGIGNTTTSSAVVSVLLGVSPESVTGRGAGLDQKGLERKIQVIRQGIAENQPNPEDGIDVLAKVGGFDLAGLAGLIIGGAIYRMPVVLDGFISGAAALAAASVCPGVKEFLLASHVSAEPAGKLVLDALSLKPVIYGDMCLGEGTGAAAFFPLLDMAQTIYRHMSTFQEIDVKEYQYLV